MGLGGAAFTPPLSPATTARSEPRFLLEKAGPGWNGIDLPSLKLPSALSRDFCLEIPFFCVVSPPRKPYKTAARYLAEDGVTVALGSYSHKQ